MPETVREPMRKASNGATSLLALLRDSVARSPDAVLAIDAGPHEAIQVTRLELWQRVSSLSAELAAAGVGKGHCVAVWLPNWSDTLVWQFAVARLGAHVVGVSTRYNVDEVAHVLETARPTVLAIAHDFVGLDLDERLRQAAQRIDARPPRVAVIAGPGRAPPAASVVATYDLGSGAWAPGAVLRIGADLQGDFEAFADELVVAFTTSGSTGKPKLAGHSSRAVAMHAGACAIAGDWRAGDVTLCALPLSGVFAFVPAITTIASGGVCLLEPVFDAAKIVKDMDRFGVTHVVAADDVVGRLGDAWHEAPAKLARWRRLLLADFNGRSLELAAWAEGQFGLVASGVYGSSELFALTSIWPAEVAAPKRWQGGGMPVSAAIEVRCVDADSGVPVASGTTGELQFRGPNVVDAYLGAPSLRQQNLTADGWFRSGDLGIVEDGGSFTYVCRAGDALRLKGFLVEPAEIEARIANHPAVQINKVVGLKLADGATEAVAFVVVNAGASTSSDELRTWCSQTLARHKVPRSIHIVEALPVTSGVNGTKIKAAELRQWAQQLEASRIETGPRKTERP